VRIVPFDPELAERTLAGASEAPDAAFDREWAFTLMERCLAQLRREYSEGARRGADAILRFFRLQAPPSYADAAKEAGMLVPQFKAALHRARARFRELVRAEIAETLDGAADLDHEMSELLRLLDR
jgi:RNA polymerase sigma-70 factor (ECF subfamily)